MFVEGGFITIVDSQCDHLCYQRRPAGKNFTTDIGLLYTSCHHQMTPHRKEQILSLFDAKSITGVFGISFSVAHYLLQASLCLCLCNSLCFYIKRKVRQ